MKEGKEIKEFTYQTMLKISTAILLFVFLVACSSNEQKGRVQRDIKKFDTNIPFAGYWVSEDYLKSINEFKSPRKAQFDDKAEAISIPERTLKPTLRIYGFHEGDASLTVLKNENKYELWQIEKDSINKYINDIEMISQNKIKINNRNFTKITASGKDANKLILEEILFKGYYTSEKWENIEFKNDGRLLGLDSFHFYSPLIDYAGDEGLNIDQIILSKDKKNQEWFGFKFNKDTLNLYKLKCLAFDSTSKNCGEVDFGKLVYKLWRKK